MRLTYAIFEKVDLRAVQPLRSSQVYLCTDSVVAIGTESGVMGSICNYDTISIISIISIIIIIMMIIIICSGDGRDSQKPMSQGVGCSRDSSARDAEAGKA